MKQYKVAFERSAYELQDRVESLLSNGWSCQGGVCVMKDGTREWYFQAMVKGC